MIRSRLRIRVYCISADRSVKFTNRCIPKWYSCGIIADVREKETFSALRCVIYRPRALEHRRVGCTPLFFTASTHLPWSIGLLRIYTIRGMANVTYLFASFVNCYREIKGWYWIKHELEKFVSNCCNLIVDSWRTW